MKRSCQNCGGIPIYPPEKKIKYDSEVDGWICDACLVSLRRQWRDEWKSTFAMIEKSKQKNEENNSNSKSRSN